MSVTDWAAWIGAVSGLGGIVWDFFKWKTSGPHLEVSAIAGMKMLPPPPKDPTYLRITVCNVGTAPTTITALGLSVYRSWLARRRHRRSKSFVVVQPAPHQPLPYRLDVGCEWTGFTIQNDEFDELAKTGTLWCSVYHSFSQTPVEARIVLPSVAPEKVTSWEKREKRDRRKVF